VPNSIKIGHGDLTIFKMAAVRHLGFKKFVVFCYVHFVGMPFCFLVQKLSEIRQPVDELWPKKRFHDGGCRHLEF